MKRRFSVIFTITVAAVLVSSIAYAAKKKLRTKSEPLAPNVSELDLASGLLDATGDQKHKSPKASYPDRLGDEVLKDLTVADKTKK
jgi:hypothetical protein